MGVLPFSEFRPDVSDLNAQYTRYLRNCIPRSDGYGPFKDVETFTQALPAACRGYFVARKEDGTALIFAGTINNLYLLDNTTLAWTEVSAGGADYTSLATDANWVFAQFNNFVVAVQKNDDPQVFDMGTPTAFADLAGSPPNAGWCAVVGRFLVLADLADDPFRIQWSALNDITGWTSGTNSSDFQDLPDQGRVYVVGEVSGDVGLIGQSGGWRRMVFAPGSELVFQIDKLPSCPGILAPYSLAITAGGAFYLSLKGFALIDSNGGYAPIGEERVDRTVLGKHESSAPASVRALAYDEAASRLVIGVSDPARSVVLFVYKSLLGAADLFDIGMIYHTTLKRWSPIEASGEFIAPVVRPGITLEGLDAIAPGVLTITGAADNGAGLIRITVASTATLTTGESKTISAVTGTTEANGTWLITVINGTTFDLQGSTFANAYVSGGIVGGSLDDLPFSLDSVSTASLPNVSIIESTHKLGFFSGDTLEAELHTPEQSLNEGYRINVNGLRPITDAGSAFCAVVKRENLRSVDDEGDESEMDDDGNCPVLEETRYGRAKLRIPAAEPWTYATGIEPETFKAGLF